MIYLLNILVAFILSLLTLSFLPVVLPFNMAPLLPLFYLIGLTYFRKGFEPILIAAITGIVLDFYSSFGFGLYLGLFVGIAVVIRLFFQEGMKEMSFGAYLLFSISALLTYFSLQIGLLYMKGVITSGDVWVKLLIFLLGNVVFMALIYPFNNWYFEKIKKLEDVQKRR
jgi:cell shape-determining protein MreD